MARILLFAAAREAAGRGEDSIDAATVGEALKIAGERYGSGFEKIAAICSVLRNGEVVVKDELWSAAIADGDEIAILPPVSGGSDFAMIDVAGKDETVREAVAVCSLSGDADVVARLLDGTVKKGDAVGAAKVAATLAAKRTPELIPLCHPVRTTYVGVEIGPGGDTTTIAIRATVRGRDRTGFEIEALVAASTAAVTLYDFAKAEDAAMRIDGLRIVAKSGGKSGSVTYE